MSGPEHGCKIHACLTIHGICRSSAELHIDGGDSGKWFIWQHADFVNERDVASISQSVEHVSSLIHKELAAGTPANQIVLAGFSQVTRTPNAPVALLHADDHIEHMTSPQPHAEPISMPHEERWQLPADFHPTEDTGAATLAIRVTWAPVCCRVATLPSGQRWHCNNHSRGSWHCPPGVKPQMRCRSAFLSANPLESMQHADSGVCRDSGIMQHSQLAAVVLQSVGSGTFCCLTPTYQQ